MELFLQIVGGVFVALVLFVIVAFLLIRWKLRSWLNQLVNSIADGLVGGIPPFRVKLAKRSELDEEDEWVPEKYRKQFEEITEEFERLGFARLEDYFIQENGMPVRTLIDVDQSTVGVIYFYPIAEVWCDVHRRYPDETSWTYANTRYHGLEIPPMATQKFFVEDTVEQLVNRFREDAPSSDMVTITKEQLPAIFEKAYAHEMDWRIERGGPTAEEIRRVSENIGEECDEEKIRNIQLQWRTAIDAFLSERALKRYRKEAELNSFQWEHLQNYGVVIHGRMHAEQLLQAFDEEYYPDIKLEDELDDGDDDDEFVAEMRAQREKWNQRISELEDALQRGTPQQVFRDMIELGNGAHSPQVKWEFQTSLTEPVVADIWTRTYEDTEENWDED